MAEITAGSGLVAQQARVVDDPRDVQESVEAQRKPLDEHDGLRAWVMNHVSRWRDHRRQNYEPLWDHYERLWRGLWAPEDKNRKSERSTIITPALGEAVENIVAEVEEAVFGRGDLFDMKGEVEDSDEAKKETTRNKNNLKEDLMRGELPVVFTTAVGEALINAAVYGSGIGEIFVKKFKLKEIVAGIQAPAGAMDPSVMQGQMPLPMGDMGAAMPAQMPPTPMQMPGIPLPPRVVTKETTFAYLQSVNPRNFLIDPTARSIDTALGVAVEEYVGAHIIKAGQISKEFRNVDVSTSAGDQDLIADPQIENEYVYDKVKIVRYYGLVPKHFIFPADKTADILTPDAPEAAEAPVDEEFTEILGEGAAKSEEPVDGEMVEAIVVIANDAVVLKLAETPYLMEDRPVVAFPWDVIPGRFWGRSVCEKGQVPQRVMDAELRARIDALAFVSAPMMAMDASKLPRGFQLTVKPGKSILTNGDPKNILNPLHFGQLDQSTFQHSQQLDQMVQRATGSLDVISLAQRAGGDARPGAVSMMLSGIVKRHKRTLMGFVDRFYVPALRKIMWRNMQFCPERYSPMNWSFTASSTMGILQREYESQNLVSLMQTMDPASKEYKVLLMGVVSNTGLTHRSQIIEMLNQSIQNAAAMEQAQMEGATNPMQAQLQQAAMTLQLKEMQAKIKELDARANLQNIKARNAAIEPEFRRAEVLTKGIYSIQADQQDRAIAARERQLDRMLEWEDIRSNERIARVQSGASVRGEAMKSAGAVASERVRARAEAEKSRADERARARESAASVGAAKASAPAPEKVAVPVPVPVRPRPAPFGTFIGRQGRVIQ